MEINTLLFSHWVEDVYAVIDKLTEGPVVLVGCSTGGKRLIQIYKLFKLCESHFPFPQVGCHA